MEPIGKDNPAPLSAQAARRGLQKPDHAQTEIPIAQGRFSLADALGEMTHDRLQGLSRLDVRAPDITRTIVDHELVPIVRALAEIDAAVVDLNRLSRVELVEDQALADSAKIIWRILTGESQLTWKLASIRSS